MSEFFGVVLVCLMSVYLLRGFQIMLNFYESKFFEAGKYLNNRSHTLSLSITIGFKYYSSTALREPCLMNIQGHGQPKILTRSGNLAKVIASFAKPEMIS